MNLAQHAAWIAEILPRLLTGFVVTLELIAISAPAGLALGITLGLLRSTAGCVSRTAASAYLIVFRGVPLLVQLFLLYYGLPRVGLVLGPFLSAVLAFTLCSAAYHAEYVRSAVLSIPEGQTEAGRALGMGKMQTIRTVILPQAVRRALPGCTNELVYLVKYSSIAYLVTLVDLTGQGRLIAYESFRFFETFLVVGLIYLTLASVVASALGAIERRVRLPE